MTSTAQLPLRQLPEAAKMPNTIVIRLWAEGDPEKGIREVVLDLDTLSDGHAAWIERKRQARGETPEPDERLDRLDSLRSRLPIPCATCGVKFRPRKRYGKVCAPCRSEISRQNGAAANAKR